MKLKRVWVIGGGCLFLMCLGLLVVILRIHFPFTFKSSDDRSLISTFSSHRIEFMKLQQMALEDSRRGWYLGISDFSGIERSRRGEYKQLTSDIAWGMDVTMNGHDNGMRFIFAGRCGLLLTDPEWIKGIEYIPGSHEQQGKLLPSLDNAGTLPDDVYLREIEPGWFLFYQRTD